MTTRKKPATVVEPSIIYSRDIADFLADALLFADTTGFLPVLDAVMLTADKGVLTATATNHYILGQRTLACWEGRPTFEPFLLAADDALDIVKVLRSRRTTKQQARGVPVDLAIADNLVVQVGPITIRCARREGEFPKYEKLLADALAYEKTSDAGTFAVNARLLAIFGRLSTRAPLEVRSTAPSRPVSVKAGDDFRGILMPVRMSSYSNEVAA